MKAIKAGSLGGCYVKMDIGSKDRLALQSLRLSEASTNITILERLLPRCSLTKRHFPIKQGLTLY